MKNKVSKRRCSFSPFLSLSFPFKLLGERAAPPRFLANVQRSVLAVRDHI